MRRTLSVLLTLSLAGCPGKQDAVPEPPAPAPQMTGDEKPREKIPVLVCTGETLGWLEPCGCTEGMLGGLPRRAAFLSQLRARGYDPILLDLGDLVEGPGRQNELKLEALAEALKLMNVKAVAMGERDLPSTVPSLVKPRNLTPPLEMLASAGTMPIGVSLVAVALIARSLDPPHFFTGDHVDTPEPNVPAGLAQVVLYHGPRDEARRLFADRKDILVIFSGHNEEVPAPAEKLPGGAWLFSCGDKGKFAAVLELKPGADPKPWPPQPLDDRVPDDLAVAKIVDDYKRRLYEENLVATLPQKPPESGGLFIGPESCKGCHPAPFAIFQRMKHAHAYDSLAPRKGTRDPECLRCHTTGFGYESGFHGVEETPALACVSCESCHGVGSNHAAAPQPGFGLVKRPAEICARCHDKENSPKFEFKTYWERIRH